MPEVIIRDALIRGLRASPDTGRNQDSLVACYNARPLVHGLVQHSPISFPSALASAIAGKGLSVSHPFPQIFRGKSETLLFSETKVYSVNESTWALTDVPLLNLSGVSATIPSGGGAWQFVDCYDTWYAFNGATTVFKAEVNGTRAVRVDTSVPTQTGCEYKGRVIFGGFDSNNFWNATHQTQHQGWTDQYINNPSGITVDGIGSNFVSWSSIGGGDTLDMLYPDLRIAGHEKYISGGHDSDRPIYFDYLDRAEAGWMPMDWQGSVWCVKPLGDFVIVYGDNGIAAIYPTVVDGKPAMGFRSIAKFGIASRTAVGGDEFRHIFVDPSGTLWALNGDLMLEELDYRENLAQFVGRQITITHDPQQREYHISGQHSTEGTKAFTLTESGFYRHKHAATSGYFLSGGMVGVHQTLSFDIVDVRTDTLDFGTRDIKTLQSIQVGSTVTNNLNVRIYYRADSNDSWLSTDLIPLNNEGFADVLISGVEFQIQVYSDDYTDFDRIDYIKATWRGDGPRRLRSLIS